MLVCPLARIDSEEVRNAPKVDIFDTKSGLFDQIPNNLPANPHFDPLIQWIQVNHLADLGWCYHPPPPPAMSLDVRLSNMALSVRTHHYHSNKAHDV